MSIHVVTVFGGTAFSAAASFDISASTSFPFGSPHGIRTAVANSSVRMIRVFSPTHFTAAHRGSLERHGLRASAEVVKMKAPGPLANSSETHI